MTFKESVNTCLREKYFTLKGRASRSEYWYFVLFYVISLSALLLTGIALAHLGNEFLGYRAERLFFKILFIVGILGYIALTIPTLTVLVRRLHDRNYSGWLVLIYFISSPLILMHNLFLLLNVAMTVILLDITIRKGSDGSNKYDCKSASENEVKENAIDTNVDNKEHFVGKAFKLNLFNALSSSATFLSVKNTVTNITLNEAALNLYKNQEDALVYRVGVIRSSFVALVSIGFAIWSFNLVFANKWQFSRSIFSFITVNDFIFILFKILFFAGFLLFGFFALLKLRQIITAKGRIIAVIINNEGVLQNMLQHKFYPWSEIESIDLVKINTCSCIEITLHSGKKSMLVLDFSGINGTELLSKMQERFERFKSTNS